MELVISNAPEPSLRGDVVLEWHGAKRMGGAAVYVWQAVLDELLRSIAIEPDSLRAGVLTGRYHAGRIDGWLSWDGFAEMARYESIDAFVEELRDDWDLTRNRVARGESAHALIGWVVSCPGSEGRLDPYHGLVHRTFFNLPWQITVVADPATQRLGVYGADEGGTLVNLGFCAVRRRDRFDSTPPTSDAP